MFVSCDCYFEEKMRGMIELTMGLIDIKYLESASLKTMTFHRDPNTQRAGDVRAVGTRQGGYYTQRPWDGQHALRTERKPMLLPCKRRGGK